MLNALKTACAALTSATDAMAEYWRPAAFTDTLADVPDRLERERKQDKAVRAERDAKLRMAAMARQPETQPLLRKSKRL